jgi:hypothetical protein
LPASVTRGREFPALIDHQQDAPLGEDGARLIQLPFVQPFARQFAPPLRLSRRGAAQQEQAAGCRRGLHHVTAL